MRISLKCVNAKMRTAWKCVYCENGTSWKCVYCENGKLWKCVNATERALIKRDSCDIKIEIGFRFYIYSFAGSILSERCMLNSTI